MVLSVGKLLDSSLLTQLSVSWCVGTVLSSLTDVDKAVGSGLRELSTFVPVSLLVCPLFSWPPKTSVGFPSLLGSFFLSVLEVFKDRPGPDLGEILCPLVSLGQ